MRGGQAEVEFTTHSSRIPPALLPPASRSHAPKLRLRLLDPHHPHAREAARKPQGGDREEWKRGVRAATKRAPTAVPRAEGEKAAHMVVWGMADVSICTEEERAEEARKAYQAVVVRGGKGRLLRHEV